MKHNNFFYNIQTDSHFNWYHIHHRVILWVVIKEGLLKSVHSNDLKRKLIFIYNRRLFYWCLYKLVFWQNNFLFPSRIFFFKFIYKNLILDTPFMTVIVNEDMFCISCIKGRYGFQDTFDNVWPISSFLVECFCPE